MVTVNWDGLNRVQPNLPAWAMQTYQVLAPRATHWRDAACAEVDCAAHANGWVTRIDESTDLGQRQAAYIRRDSRRGYTEAKSPDGLTEFTFQPGQKCFTKHQVPVGRPELFYVKGGDWRGNPRQIPARQHVRAEDWIEDFGEHQQRIRDAQEKG